MPSRSNEEELKNLLVMCSLSAVCILGDPSATLGMTYYTNIHASQRPYFSPFTFHFSLSITTYNYPKKKAPGRSRALEI